MGEECRAVYVAALDHRRGEACSLSAPTKVVICHGRAARLPASVRRGARP